MKHNCVSFQCFDKRYIIWLNNVNTFIYYLTSELRGGSAQSINDLKYLFPS